ncbi:MAG: nucleoside deaminase [Ruminiclostridium sp.]|nr:nucleoside deaminase [Ruminiclostridium sp.]
MKEFMKAALDEAYKGIDNGDGGPFGAVIVRDGIIVGRGHNCVLSGKNPVLHGEIMAITDACRKLGTHLLDDCEIYTTAEPCPMCMGAILWAGIKAVYYGCNTKDTESIGFRDEVFYKMLNSENMGITYSEYDREECLKLFRDYSGRADKQLY